MYTDETVQSRRHGSERNGLRLATALGLSGVELLQGRRGCCPLRSSFFHFLYFVDFFLLFGFFLTTYI